MDKLKKVVGILLIITTMTGCVKYKSTMTINADKSMTYEGVYLFSDKLLGSMGSENSILTEEEKKSLTDRGITVNEKKENGYSGIEVSKKYENIDNNSNETGKEVIMSDFLDEKFDDSVLFKVEKGFLKNKYTATFKYEANASDPRDTDYEDEANDVEAYVDNDEVSTEVITDPGESNTGDDTIVDEDENVDYSDLMGLAAEMEFKYIVNLPEKALTSNATETTNDGKTLTWTFEQNAESKIEFSFELKNMTNYYILYGGVAAGVILLIIIIIVIIKKIKKRKNDIPAGEPIHTDFDPSIAQAIPNPTLVNSNEQPLIQEQNLNVENVQPKVENDINDIQSNIPVNNIEPEPIQNIDNIAINGPIGNDNVEAQAHILPEVKEEPVIVEPQKAPVFITPQIEKEEPIITIESQQEIQVDKPQTIDMN